MPRDEDRIARIQKVLAHRGWAALVCALPENVLMLSGYWPVIGSSIAIVTREGATYLLVPEDELHLAQKGWADSIRTFKWGSLDRLDPIAVPVSNALAAKSKDFFEGRQGDMLGFEGGAYFDPAGYASSFVYGREIEKILSAAYPRTALIDATPALEELRSVLTDAELRDLREACGIAHQAYLQAAQRIESSMREFEIANTLRRRMFSADSDVQRSGGFAYCMSGPNSAKAYAAFQESHSRAISPGEFVLLHCNSYYKGFWTDITRTFCIGEPDQRTSGIMDAVLEASRTALDSLRPGIHASAVDRAARQVLEDRGFGKQFKHAAGHGVGFSAINHNARPRIHPLSDEVLEPGMVFNVEPAVYIDGYGGMRQCNMVVITENGYELLTPFQQRKDLLLI